MTSGPGSSGSRTGTGAGPGGYFSGSGSGGGSFGSGISSLSASLLPDSVFAEIKTVKERLFGKSVTTAWPGLAQFSHFSFGPVHVVAGVQHVHRECPELEPTMQS
jgi:hypothetical protein